MEILIVVAFAIVLLIVGILLGVNYEKNIYFNSCAYKIESDKFSPKFEIVKIEESLDIDCRLIAKYTVRNHFFAKKNNKAFKYQTFYFYDKIGKYEIGQELGLN